MYDVPSLKGISKVIINEKVITEKGEPKLIKSEPKKAKKKASKAKSDEPQTVNE